MAICLMGIFVLFTFGWSLKSMLLDTKVSTASKNNSVTAEKGTNGAKEKNADKQKESEQVDMNKLAEKLLNQVQFDTELSKADDNVAGEMLRVSQGSELQLYMGNGSYSDELILITAQTEEQAQEDQKAVEQHLKDTKKSFEAYIPEQAKKISDAVIARSGCYVAACVTSDYDNAKNIIVSAFE